MSKGVPRRYAGRLVAKYRPFRRPGSHSLWQQWRRKPRESCWKDSNRYWGGTSPKFEIPKLPFRGSEKGGSTVSGGRELVERDPLPLATAHAQHGADRHHGDVERPGKVAERVAWAGVAPAPYLCAIRICQLPARAAPAGFGRTWPRLGNWTGGVHNDRARHKGQVNHARVTAACATRSTAAPHQAQRSTPSSWPASTIAVYSPTTCARQP